MSAEVIIYGKNNCPYCEHAKNFFEQQKIAFTYYNTSEDPAKLEEMYQLIPKARTFPQIIINKEPIGGFSDLKKLDEEGKLDSKLDPDKFWASIL